MLLLIKLCGVYTFQKACIMWDRAPCGENSYCMIANHNEYVSFVNGSLYPFPGFFKLDSIPEPLSSVVEVVGLDLLSGNPYRLFGALRERGGQKAGEI